MVFMTEEKVMDSPEQKKRPAGEERSRSKPPADRSAEEQESQATTEEFEQEGMGVAPKE
jgi:hypothetical protein